MLTLDQVKLLEDKVESLIGAVKALYEERDLLRDALQKKDKEIEELTTKVNAYETEQTKIEERVVNALNQLDVFQNSVASAKAILSQANESDPQMQGSESMSDSQEEQTTEASATSSNPHEENNSENGVSSSSSVSQDTQADESVVDSDDKEENKKEENEENTDKQMDIF